MDWSGLLYDAVGDFDVYGVSGRMTGRGCIEKNMEGSSSGLMDVIAAFTWRD